jgi:signal transduction histidine kinase
MDVADGTLTLSLLDDGCGFDPQSARDGNGLPNMSARARGIGGMLEVASQPGRGTNVILTVPIGARISVPV